MAVPIEFEECNAKFGVSEHESDVQDLPVFFDGEHIVSCWALTEEERKHVAETGVVWLMVWGSATPPVCVVGEKPFAEVAYDAEPDGEV